MKKFKLKGKTLIKKIRHERTKLLFKIDFSKKQTKDSLKTELWLERSNKIILSNIDIESMVYNAARAMLGMSYSVENTKLQTVEEYKNSYDPTKAYKILGQDAKQIIFDEFINENPTTDL